MLNALILIANFLYVAPTYDAYFAFPGKDFSNEIILQDCHIVIGFSIDNFDSFCKKARWALGTPVTFCLRTGLSSEQRCNEIVSQNINNNSLIELNLDYDLIIESY